MPGPKVDFIVIVLKHYTLILIYTYTLSTTSDAGHHLSRSKVLYLEIEMQVLVLETKRIAYKSKDSTLAGEGEKNVNLFHVGIRDHGINLNARASDDLSFHITEVHGIESNKMH